MPRPITGIYGMEPNREGYEPAAHVVGFDSHIAGRGKVPVDWIERREENLGTYGLVWYDVLPAGVVVASMQGMAVAEVHYGPEVAA